MSLPDAPSEDRRALRRESPCGADGPRAQRATEGARGLPLVPRLDDDLDPPHRRPAALALGYWSRRRRAFLRPLPIPLGVRIDHTRGRVRAGTRASRAGNPSRRPSTISALVLEPVTGSSGSSCRRPATCAGSETSAPVMTSSSSLTRCSSASVAQVPGSQSTTPASPPTSFARRNSGSFGRGSVTQRAPARVAAVLWPHAWPRRPVRRASSWRRTRLRSLREWPREESNLRPQIRSLSLYPLSYGASRAVCPPRATRLARLRARRGRERRRRGRPSRRTPCRRGASARSAPPRPRERRAVRALGRSSRRMRCTRG